MTSENLYSARRNVEMPRGRGTPKWLTEYWIYHEDGDHIEVMPFHGPEWRKVHKIIMEFEPTGESPTLGYPMQRPFKFIFDENGYRDPYYMSYEIIDGKIKWFAD